MDNLKEAGQRIRATQSLMRSQGMTEGENHRDLLTRLSTALAMTKAVYLETRRRRDLKLAVRSASISDQYRTRSCVLRSTASEWRRVQGARSLSTFAPSVERGDEQHLRLAWRINCMQADDLRGRRTWNPQGYSG